MVWITTYGEGGFDPSKPNNNIVEIREIADDPIPAEMMAQTLEDSVSAALLVQVVRNQRDEIEFLKAENESLSNDLTSIISRLDAAGL